MSKTISSGNWSFRQPPLEEGDTVQSGNFSQLLPHTPVAAGIANLTIKGGNWTNVQAKASWTIQGGTWRHISFCSHLHPDWVQSGLPVCVDNCVHVIDTDTVTVDAQTITVYHYQNKVVV